MVAPSRLQRVSPSKECLQTSEGKHPHASVYLRSKTNRGLLNRNPRCQPVSLRSESFASFLGLQLRSDRQRNDAAAERCEPSAVAQPTLLARDSGRATQQDVARKLRSLPVSLIEGNTSETADVSTLKKKLSKLQEENDALHRRLKERQHASPEAQKRSERAKELEEERKKMEQAAEKKAKEMEKAAARRAKAAEEAVLAEEKETMDDVHALEHGGMPKHPWKLLAKFLAMAGPPALGAYIIFSDSGDGGPSAEEMLQPRVGMQAGAPTGDAAASSAAPAAASSSAGPTGSNAAAAEDAAAGVGAAAATAAEEPIPDDMDAQARVQFEARQAQERAGAMMADLWDRVTPVLARGQEAWDTFQRRVDTVQNRGKQLFESELQAAQDELMSLITRDFPPMDISGLARLPSVPLLIAGYFAPGQLKGLYAENLMRLGFTSFMFLFDATACYYGHGGDCPTIWFFHWKIDFLLDWMEIDCSVLLLDMCVRLKAHMEISNALQKMNDAEARMEESQPDMSTLSADEKINVYMERYLLKGAIALLSYDKLKGSKAFRSLPMLSVFDFFWQMIGWTGYFDTPAATCDSSFLLHWARTRGMIFILFLVPNIINLALTVVKIAIESPQVGVAVLQAANAMDTSVFPPPDGLPVFSTAVRAFLMRDASDLAGMEATLLQAEEGIARAEQQKAAAAKAAADAEFAAAEAKLDVAASRTRAQDEVVRAIRDQDREFARRYRGAVDEAMTITQAAQAAARAQESLLAGEIPAMPGVFGGGGASSSGAAAQPAAADGEGPAAAAEEEAPDEAPEAGEPREATGGTADS
eukprot:TRINITY_DN14210_c0_g1_i2.p1 TRINITY_DN14210_c0_g1~~TRINITY_DN14210_c0_g1_i2.p1  ORF type:complete len:814 (+),score=162.88 TRINITY_DN14210_c0_g1_i2:93-2534(+)